LIEDLTRMGTKRVRFTGGGEPFMHPRLPELLRMVKEAG